MKITQSKRTRVLDEQFEELKQDIIHKRARLQCADVGIYLHCSEVVVSKLYYDVFKNKYYEKVSKCYTTIGEVYNSTYEIDRMTVEKDWLCRKAYPARVRYVREHHAEMVASLQQCFERTGSDEVRACLEEGVRIVKFMGKDTRF